MTTSTRLYDFLSLYVDKKYEKIPISYKKWESLRPSLTKDEYLRIHSFLNIDSSLNCYGLDFNNAF